MRFLAYYAVMYALLLMMVVMLGVQLSDPPPVAAARLKIFDSYQQNRPRELKQLPVIIVDIDEESLKAYGQWPRTLFATLITTLTDAGVAAIGFDVVFAEPVARKLRQNRRRDRRIGSPPRVDRRSPRFLEAESIFV